MVFEHKIKNNYVCKRTKKKKKRLISLKPPQFIIIYDIISDTYPSVHKRRFCVKRAKTNILLLLLLMVSASKSGPPTEFAATFPYPLPIILSVILFGSGDYQRERLMWFSPFLFRLDRSFKNWRHIFS